MDKQTLVRRITAENNGKIFVTQSSGAKILGMGRDSFRKMMLGYDYKVQGKGNAKIYLVDDVADAFIHF